MELRVQGPLQEVTISRCDLTEASKPKCKSRCPKYKCEQPPKRRGRNDPPLGYSLKEDRWPETNRYPRGILQTRNRRFRCKPAEVKDQPPECQPTLNGPVGVLLSVFNLQTFAETYEIDYPIEATFEMSFQTAEPYQALATCFAAFGYGFTTPESEWTEVMMNDILRQGQVIFRNSLKSMESFVSPKEQIIKRFLICRNAMHVQVSEPIVIGTLEVRNCRVYSILIGLEMFMQKFDHCLCEIKEIFLLIWRRHNAFFLFDCYGRNASCYRDIKNGYASLICVCNIKNIGFIIQHMTNFQPTDVYSLYHIQMKGVLECCDEINLEVSPPRQADFKLFGDNHAVLEGNLHIAHENFRYTLRKQALASAVIGIIYSKVDPPCTWDSAVLDKVLSKGAEFHQKLTKNNLEKSLSIYDIPANIQLGQYVVSIRAIPRILETTWTLASCRSNPALVGIKRLFTQKKAKNLLIQVDRRVYAAWVRNDFFYIFNPYERTIIDASLKGPEKHSTIHMLNTLEKFCSILNEDVICAPMPSHFVVHVVKVVRIRGANIKKLTGKERRMPCTVPMAERVGPSMRDDFMRRGLEDSRDGVNGCEEYEEAGPFDQDEVVSLNESIYDFECLLHTDADLELYDTGDDELDSPAYSDRQITKDSDIPLTDAYPDGMTSDEERSVFGGGQSVKSDEDDFGWGDDWTGKGKGKKKHKKRGSEDSDESDSQSGKSDESWIDSDGNIRKGGRRGKGYGSGKDSDKGSGRGGSLKSGKGSKRGSKKDSKKDSGKSGGKYSGSERGGRRGGGGNGGEDSDDEETTRGRRKSKKNKRGSKLYAEDDESSGRVDKDGNKKRKSKKGKGGTGSISGGSGRSRDRKSILSGKRDSTRKSERRSKDKAFFHDDKEDGQGSHGPSRGSRKRSTSKSRGRDHSSVEVDGSEYEQSESGRIESDGSERTSEAESPRSSKIEPPGNPNTYPGYRAAACNMAVIGSENGSYKSLCSLISSGFRVSDRILAMTPWGNYALFKLGSMYYLFDGCTCNPERFRHLDLSVGTAGLLGFQTLHDLIMALMQGKKDFTVQRQGQTNKYSVDSICREFCK